MDSKVCSLKLNYTNIMLGDTFLPYGSNRHQHKHIQQKSKLYIVFIVLLKIMSKFCSLNFSRGKKLDVPTG